MLSECDEEAREPAIETPDFGENFEEVGRNGFVSLTVLIGQTNLRMRLVKIPKAPEL